MIYMNIGLIGAGAIGIFLLETLNMDQAMPGYRIVSVYDDREKSTISLQEIASTYAVQSYNDLVTFLQSDVDIIVECANVQVVKQVAARIVAEKDLLITSIGALSDAKLYTKLKAITKSSEQKIYLPSGAIGGLDIIKAAKVMDGLDAVTLITRKPLVALSNESLVSETVLFEGSAKDAIEKYPKNMNVAITLSLAGIGVENTKVKIIADPYVEKNIHMITAQGDFGKMEMTIENNPSPTNVKTSYLTALSILSSLRSLDEQVCIG